MLSLGVERILDKDSVQNYSCIEHYWLVCCIKYQTPVNSLPKNQATQAQPMC